MKQINYSIVRGDLLFFYPERISEKVIAYYDGKYYHTGIALGNGYYLSATWRGVSISQIPDRKIDVFVIDKKHKEVECMIKFLLGFIGRKYDFLGLVAFLFNIPILNSTRRFYCSELMAIGLNSFGYGCKTDISPLQLSNLDILEYVLTTRPYSEYNIKAELK